jgi:hypothetical protein
MQMKRKSEGCCPSRSCFRDRDGESRLHANRGQSGLAIHESLHQHGNTARNYFAVAHPSLTNHLEVVGGSNFGVLNDNNWIGTTNCVTNLPLGSLRLMTANTRTFACTGSPTDAATLAIDFSNETSGVPGAINIDSRLSIPAEPSPIN